MVTHGCLARVEDLRICHADNTEAWRCLWHMSGQRMGAPCQKQSLLLPVNLLTEQAWFPCMSLHQHELGAD